MRLQAIANLDDIARQLRKLRGLDCGYCDVLHPVGQCKQPINWSAEAPVRSSTAVFLADETGAHWQYLKQLKREQRREMLLTIKP
jgi:hypothetical protein